MSVVLVTGSSSGIGLATALHFARLGHDVYAGVRNPATAGELTAAIAGEKLPIRTVGLDVDDDASVTRGVAEVVAASGRVDVLVNNAGIGGGGPLADVPVDFAKALFETAQEVYAFGIRVAIVEPGVVITPIFSKARRFADPASPFAVHVRRLLLLYQLAREMPSHPEDVARVIHEAATGREMSEDEFLALNRQRYGFGR